LYDLAIPWAQPTVDTIDAIRPHVNLAAASFPNVPDQAGAPKLIIDLSSFRVACVIDQDESSKQYLVKPEPFGSGPTSSKKMAGATVSICRSTVKSRNVTNKLGTNSQD
jgi:hypothetical protein